MQTITKRLEWDSAHRVLRHESKCATLHGHRYAAEITVSAPRGLDDVGRIVDFGVIKTVIGTWIDTYWDHATLVNSQDERLLAFCKGEAERGNKPAYVFPSEPTAENIAAHLFKVCETHLPSFLRVENVRVWETPTSCADHGHR